MPCLSSCSTSLLFLHLLSTASLIQVSATAWFIVMILKRWSRDLFQGSKRLSGCLQGHNHARIKAIQMWDRPVNSNVAEYVNWCGFWFHIAINLCKATTWVWCYIRDEYHNYLEKFPPFLNYILMWGQILFISFIQTTYSIRTNVEADMRIQLHFCEGRH